MAESAGMSRIGGLGRLGADQVRALNRLREIGQAISQNTQRLSTLRRINSAKDDPAGLVRATLLESELIAAEASRKSIDRADAILSLADTTAGDVVSQLQSARTLILQVAGGTLSSSEVAANQVQVDSILGQVDRLARTEFAGRRLLNGESGYSTSGVNTAQVLDVDVLSKATGDAVTVSIDVTTQAAQATNSYTGGTLAADTTVIVEGPDGTTTISLAAGADTQAIADAYNDVAYLTGVTATRVDANQVDFATADYGSAATISIEATQGTFDLTTSGEVSGTDAVATINGQTVTGDGSTFNIHGNEFSAIVEVDPTVSGAVTDFTISGSGLAFNTGPSPTDASRIGLPNLTTASLGGVDGKLYSIGSGGANSIAGGNAATALRIIDDAIADAVRGQAAIGGFQKFNIESSSNVVGKTIENLTSALSDVRDTDVALETALLTNNQLIQQSAFGALAITNLQGQGVLGLLQNAFQPF
jgi:flagellin